MCFNGLIPIRGRPDSAERVTRFTVVLAWAVWKKTGDDQVRQREVCAPADRSRQQSCPGVQWSGPVLYDYSGGVGKLGRCYGRCELVAKSGPGKI